MSKDLTLVIYGQFQCIGDQCPASCCIGWDLDVDNDTWARWQAMPEEAGKPLLASVQKPSAGTSLLLRQKDNGECIHLQQGWCAIQKQWGHDFLPLTCRVYPRVYSTDEVLKVNSLALSCPAVLNLLFAKSNIAWLKQPIERDVEVMADIQKLDSGFGGALLKIVIEAMGLVRYESAVQLYFIGDVLVEISAKSEQGMLKLKDIKDIHKRLKPRLFQTKKKAARQLARVNPILNAQFWRLVRSVMPSAFNLIEKTDRDLEAVIHLLTKPDISEAELEQLHANILVMREQALACLPDDYQDNMRAYLQVKFFNNGFPWNPIEGNVVAGYLFCLLPYALIQLLVWIKLAAGEEMTAEEIKKIVYSVERYLDHNQTIYQLLAEHTELLQLDSYLDCVLQL